MEEDLQLLHDLGLKHGKSPLVRKQDQYFAKINSLQNKISDFSVFMWYVLLNYFVVGETKEGNILPS